MCRAWAHKCQHYFDLESMGPMGQALIFQAKHHATYEEPQELLDLLEGPMCTQAIRDRVVQLREVFHAD